MVQKNFGHVGTVAKVETVDRSEYEDAPGATMSVGQCDNQATAETNGISAPEGMVGQDVPFTFYWNLGDEKPMDYLGSSYYCAKFRSSFSVVPLGAFRAVGALRIHCPYGTFAPVVPPRNRVLVDRLEHGIACVASVQVVTEVKG